jgi:photosystem II stability/assembly factor-like uncharacterized protein
MRSLFKLTLPLLALIFTCAWPSVPIQQRPGQPHRLDILSVASAGTNAWTSLGPEGGRIEAVAADPSRSGVFYAGTFDGTALYKTTDSGATWSTVNTGQSIKDAVDAITVDSQGTVYVGCNGAFLKGTAHGSNWSSAQGVNSLINSIAVASPTVIYASTRGSGVLKSSDGGATFQPANSGLATTELSSIAIDSSGNLYCAAFSGGGVFKADSAASNWSPVNTGLPAQDSATQLIADGLGAVYAVYYASVYKTTDGGAHWNPADSGLTVGGLVLAMDSGGTIYALGSPSSKLFKSTDAASTWNPLNSGLPDSTQVQALAVDSSRNTICAGTEEGVFRTTGAFTSWTYAGAGFNATEVNGLAFDPTSAGTLFASVFGGGVYKSIDNGSTWTLTSEPQVFPGVVRVDSGGVVFAGASGGLRRSTDHGATWSVPTGIQPLSISGLDVSSSTYYAGGPGVSRSTDKGATWNSTTTGLNGISIITVAVDPTNNMLVYAGSIGQGLFKSVDAGASWNPAGTGFSGSFPHGLVVDSTGAVYAGAETGLFKSTDSGQTWTPLKNGLNVSIFSVAVDPSNPATVYAGSNGVYRSTDSGASWAQLSSAGYPAAFPAWAVAIDPANHGSIFAGTMGGGAIQGQFGGGPAIAAAAFTPPKKLSISGTAFSASPSVKINGVDVSGFIRSASDTSISMRGKARALGLVTGANSIQVFDNNGAGSGVFTLNL